MQSILEGRRRACVFSSGAVMHSVLCSVAECSINDILLFIVEVLEFVNFKNFLF